MHNNQPTQITKWVVTFILSRSNIYSVLSSQNFVGIMTFSYFQVVFYEVALLFWFIMWSYCLQISYRKTCTNLLSVCMHTHIQNIENKYLQIIHIWSWFETTVLVLAKWMSQHIKVYTIDTNSYVYIINVYFSKLHTCTQVSFNTSYTIPDTRKVTFDQSLQKN